MEIGILGGTGSAGRAIAARLASVGFEVILGSRNRYRALEACDGLLEKWP
ncbi:MAG: NAD(P)-binding domain-containing protein, partial [Acidimicrobiales bacterium]|nr:NAD(P)-binding domain-containing protein [Acidimicrobiales bacterium]